VGYNFRPVERDQQFLLPPSIRDWLPADHLAWFVLDAVAELDTSALYRRHRADGHGAAAYEPGMMAALLLYAYATGERSSRRIEERCRVDLAYRAITANALPDHATIARFRAAQADALAGLFTGILAVCARAGMGRLGLIALDGTRIAAATEGPGRTAAELEAEIAAILREAADVDAAEDEAYGADRRGDELPPALAARHTRLERLREAKRQLDEEAGERAAAEAARAAERAAREAATGKRTGGRKPGPARPPKREPRRNPTDPDSRPMKTMRGWIQGYNAQAAVSADGLVLAADLTACSNDYDQLVPMVNLLRANVEAAGFRVRRSALVADGGYWRGAAVEDLEAEGGPLLLIPPWRPRAHHDQDRRPPPERARMAARLETTAGQALYRRRATTVEPLFGQLKDARGFRRFSRRSTAACRAEWRLACMAHNLRKLWGHRTRQTAAAAGT
jgi:transposase